MKKEARTLVGVSWSVNNFKFDLSELNIRAVFLFFDGKFVGVFYGFWTHHNRCFELCMASKEIRMVVSQQSPLQISISFVDKFSEDLSVICGVNNDGFFIGFQVICIDG